MNSLLKTCQESVRRQPCVDVQSDGLQCFTNLKSVTVAAAKLWCVLSHHSTVDPNSDLPVLTMPTSKRLHCLIRSEIRRYRQSSHL